MMVLGEVTDRFPPVLGLDVTGVVDNVGGLDVELGVELGIEVGVVLERGGSLVVEGGVGEAVVVGEDGIVEVKLRGTPVPVTDVTVALEAGVSVEDVGRELLGEEVETPLPGELKEALVAMDEVTVAELEIVEAEERSSVDDAEVEAGKDEIVVDDDVGLLLWGWGSVVGVGVEEDWVDDGGEVGV
jgi:hypothetical protein